MTKPAQPKPKAKPKPAPKPVGRPTKYRPENVEQAKKLATLGATDREIADFFEVNEATLNRWKLAHPEFCESLKVGKAEADERVEQALYRRALGYSHDATKIAINASGDVTQVPFVEHYPPDTTAAIFWLKNRKPEDWRDVSRQEHSGPNGAPIPVESKIDVSGLSTDQLRALASIKVPAE
jgi:hypothetical protein